MFFLNYGLSTYGQIIILIIFIFPMADLEHFSLCNVIHQIKKSGLTDRIFF